MSGRLGLRGPPAPRTPLSLRPPTPRPSAPRGESERNIDRTKREPFEHTGEGLLRPPRARPASAPPCRTRCGSSACGEASKPTMCGKLEKEQSCGPAPPHLVARGAEVARRIVNGAAKARPDGEQARDEAGDEVLAGAAGDDGVVGAWRRGIAEGVSGKSLGKPAKAQARRQAPAAAAGGQKPHGGACPATYRANPPIHQGPWHDSRPDRPK